MTERIHNRFKAPDQEELIIRCKGKNPPAKHIDHCMAAWKGMGIENKILLMQKKNGILAPVPRAWYIEQEFRRETICWDGMAKDFNI